VGSRQPVHDRDYERPVHSLDAAARASATWRGEQVGSDASWHSTCMAKM